MPSAIRTLELSAREQQVLWWYGAEGEPIKRVASGLGISVETGKSYLKRIREKLRKRGVRADSRVDLFRAALTECADMPACRLLRDEMLRELLTEDAPERLLRAA